MANEQFDNILSDIATDEITTLEQLYNIQAKYAPSNVYLPLADNIYDIDLNTRMISGPDFISVQRDHKSEVIYFKVDRYFDYMDLSTTICIIEYIVPEDTVPHIYVVPFFDTHKFVAENKMIFPWNVGGAATSKDGTIKYAIRFYKVKGERENARIAYNLSTLPTESKILPSIEGDGEIMKVPYDIPIAPYYEDLIYQMRNNRTYWEIL